MLSIFRQNQSALALLLAGYVFLLRWPALFGLIIVDAPEAQGGGSLYLLLPEIVRIPGVFSAVVSAVLVWIQAVVVNQVIDRSRLLAERNWFPGVFYAYAASCTAELQYLSPALVAVTLTPVAFRLLPAMYNKKEVTTQVFDLGFWLGFGSLIYPLYIWLLPAAFPAVGIWRSFSLRERVVFFMGVVVVLFLAFTAFFWFDSGVWFWTTQNTVYQNGMGVVFPGDWAGWIKLCPLLLLTLFVAINFSAFYTKRLIQAQKVVSTLLWLWAIGFVSYALKPLWPNAHWAMPAFSTGCLLALRMLDLRNFALAETLHFLLVLLLYTALFFDKIQPFLI